FFRRFTKPQNSHCHSSREKSLERRWGNRVNEGLTAKRLQGGRPERAVAAGRKPHAIYAAPPWAFEVYSGKGKQRSAERPACRSLKYYIPECGLVLGREMPWVPPAGSP